MRKRLGDAFCILLFAWLVAGLGCAVAVAQEAQPPAHAQSAEEAQTEEFPKCEDRSFWQRSACDPVAAYTGVLALFTGMLILISGIQIRFLIRADDTARRSVETAERALTVVERAFVAFGSFSVTTIAQYGIIIDYRIHINITNSGRTPAKNYRATANLAVFDNGIPNGFRYPDRQEDGAANSVLGPQAKGYIQVDLFVADAVAIYEKRKEALIYGWIEYDDVFPDSPRHRTELCATVEVFADPRAVPQIQSGEGIPIMTLRPYGKYNAYDGDCLYQPGETPVAGEGELPALTPPPLVNQPRMDI